jgi:uncharacterized protein YaiL (DUF2058 family)
MAGSLQDQLLRAGLTDPKQAKKLAREQRKKANQARRSGDGGLDEAKQAATEARQAKLQRDRELNDALNSKAQRKAINAQIKQLIETSKLQKGKGEIAFSFPDGKKVKQLYVTALQQQQLAAGVLAIVKQGDQYEIVPGPVAAKIAERDETRIIQREDNEATSLTQEQQDWYKDYEIPDDLMW